MMGRFHRRRGVALLTALAVLGLVSMLGTSYFQFAVLDEEAARLAADAGQARAVVERAIYRAIAESAARIDAEPLPAAFTYDDLAIYGAARDETRGLFVRDDLRGAATVTVADETAKLNLNYAPVRLLASVLNVSPDTARDIRASVPRPGEAPNAERSWFVHPDELVLRGFIAEEAYAALPLDIVTTYTVPGQTDPKGFLNVNAAAPEVLAGILGVDRAQAEAVAAQRPFADLDAFVAATGKQAAEFALPPGPSGIAEELTLTSRLYRFRGEAAFERSGPSGWEPVAQSAQEAVVYFAEDGTHHILSWRSLAAPERTAETVQ